MTMHRRPRNTAVAAGATLVVSAMALAACGGGGSGDGAEAAPAVTQEEIDAAMSTPTDLVFWTWLPDVQNQIDMFEAEYPDIDVEVVNVGQGADHYRKVRSALEAGSGAPDVAQFEYQHLQSFALGENLLDLTPYLPEDISDDYVDWAWQQVQSVDGSQILAIPQDSGPTGMLYREDIFTEAGIEPPTTWEEFEQAGRTLREANPDSYITNMPGNDMGQWVSVLWQAGARPFSWDGAETVSIDLTSEEATMAADYWTTLIADDLVSTDPDFNDAWYQGLNSGKYASWTPTAAWAPVFLQGSAASTSGLWRAAPGPQWEAGANVASNWGGSTDAVLAGTENPIAASQLALYINHATEPAMALATEQLVFPVSNEVLESPEFLDQEVEFFGGQQVNALFADISANVDTGFGWLPFTDFAYSAGEETVGQAIADGTDIAVAMQAWEDQLKAYAEQQGFTVTEE